MARRIMRKKIMYTAVVLVLGVVASIALSACGSAQSSGTPELKKVTLVLDWTPNTNHTGIYVSEDKGYYRDAGLEVEIQTPPEDGATGLVASGQAQFGIDYQQWLAFALEKDVPVSAVRTILQQNTSDIISLKSKNITRPKDLEGKRFAWEGSEENRKLFEAMIHADGGNPDLVQWINYSCTNIVGCLSGDLDAVSGMYYGWEGIQAELSSLEINNMYPKDYLPDANEYSPILIANNSFSDEHPDLALKFIEATEKGYQYAADHPDDSAKILIAKVPDLDSDLTRKSQEYLSTLYLDEHRFWGLIDPERWNHYYSWMHEAGMLERDLDDNVGLSRVGYYNLQNDGE